MKRSAEIAQRSLTLAIAAAIAAAILAGAVFVVRGRGESTSSGESQAADTLDEIADSMASSNAEPAPEKEQYVETTRASAVEAIGPGTVVDTNQPVYLIKVEGDFVGELAKVPPGQDAPKGRFLYIIVDSSTFAINDWAIVTRTST